MAYTAWLVGKNESGRAVECQIEYRPDVGSDPDMVAFTETVLLDPETDGITDAATARNVLRTKVTIRLNQLNKIDALGDLVESNLGAQILPLAAQPAPQQIAPKEE